MNIIKDFIFTLVFFVKEALSTFLSVIVMACRIVGYIIQNIIAPLFGSVIADISLILNIITSSILIFLHQIFYLLSVFLFRLAKTCKFNSERIIIRNWEVH